MAQKLVDIGCPQDKVRVWRLGVDVERIEFVPRVAGERVRLLICAGHKEKKGIPYALKALAAALECGLFSAISSGASTLFRS